jgi:hypothetical protein
MAKRNQGVESLVAPALLRENYSRRDSMSERELGSAEIRAAWMGWLRTYPWDHFVTLTFRKSVSIDVALFEFRRWRRRIEQRAQQPIQWFYVVEGEASTSLHLHILVQGSAGLRGAELRQAWPNGWTSASRCREGRNAARYVAKHLDRAATEFGISLA